MKKLSLVLAMVLTWGGAAFGVNLMTINPGYETPVLADGTQSGAGPDYAVGWNGLYKLGGYTLNPAAADPIQPTEGDNMFYTDTQASWYLQPGGAWIFGAQPDTIYTFSIDYYPLEDVIGITMAWVNGGLAIQKGEVYNAANSNLVANQWNPIEVSIDTSVETNFVGAGLLIPMFFQPGSGGSFGYLDNASVTITGPLGYIGPFPALANVTGPNLIPNGGFDQITNIDPPGELIVNLNGSWGDAFDWEGRTGDAPDWSFYKNDPNGLADLVGTPHQATADTGVLNGTLYLDTLLGTTSGGWLALNSSMEYGNGVVQTNILSAVSIDTNATYEFSVRPSVNAGLPYTNATLTAAVTAGADAANTASAVTDGLLQIPATNITETFGGNLIITEVSGAELDAAGQVNVLVNYKDVHIIPGVPTNVAPADVVDPNLVSQCYIHEVSLAKVLPAVFGDVNRNGFLDNGDVSVALQYLTGSIDGGEHSETRQTEAITGGMTPNEALVFLDLTDFDIDGNDFFDAADITALEALVEEAKALVLHIAGGSGATLDFEWNSRGSSKLYDLESVESPTNSNWSPYNDGSTTYSNILGSGAGGTSTLTGVLAPGTEMVFRLLERFLAFDDFSTYTNGPAHLQAGSPFGFGGTWLASGVNSISNGVLTLASPDDVTYTAQRSFDDVPITESGTVYIRAELAFSVGLNDQFVQIGPNSVFGAPNILLDGKDFLGTGGYQLFADAGSQGLSPIIGIGEVDGLMHTWLIEWNLDSGACTAWLDPDVNAFDPAIGPKTSISSSSPVSFEGIIIICRNTGDSISMDEIKVGGTWESVDVTLAP